jgi:aldehyde:ferredoxin oxidoreductase
LFGYRGKYIRVNLSTGEIDIEPLDDALFRKYIGGVGIAAKFIHDETTPETGPLSPENVLASFTGPFTGTRIPSSSRNHVVALSPQTGIFGEANVGGSWGVQLKRSGFDGVVITGKSATPVYLWISDEKVELRDASPIWGQDAFDAAEWLRGETDKRATAAVIGQAGENQVRYASIPHVGKIVRSAGRTGMGAVMGSKNLKAMVAYGTMPLLLADEDALNASVKSLVPHVRDATDDFRRYGTSGGVEKYEYIGNFPIKNWQGSRWKEGAEKISGVRMHDTILTGNKSCRGCVISCVRHVKIEEGPYAGLDTDGPEYETIGTLGGECLVDDLDAICKANELCNRYGLDTISTGAAIAFGMEAYEKGLITKEDTEGLELVWGNAEAMVEMVHRIAKGENVGKLLGLGTKKAAEVLGRNAIEFSVQVKGLEPSAHDPRRFWTQALSYATAARGACHNRSWGHPYELGLSLPELGLDKPQKSYELEGLAEYVAKLQNFQTLNDTLVICRFAQVGSAVSLAKTVEWYNMITGFDLSVEELVVVGERIFNLKRMFNVRLGISRKDDFLPPRFMTLNRKDKELNTQLPPIGEMLGDFYEYRGWDEIGIPTEEKLAELELSELNA